MSKLVDKLNEQYKTKPVVTVTTVIAALAGIVAIISGVYSGIGWAKTLVVTPAQLQASEDRIIKQYREEALIIRNAILSDLNSQVAGVNKLLLKATTIGEVELYKLRIAALNKRIDELRGE